MSYESPGLCVNAQPMKRHRSVRSLVAVAVMFSLPAVATFVGGGARAEAAGVVSNYRNPPSGRCDPCPIVNPVAITTGSDGAMWFTNEGKVTKFIPAIPTIGRITAAGAITTYTDPSLSQPGQITAGPDGALWFTNLGSNSIGRITTAGVVTNYTGAHISNPGGITAGSDGALWFTNGGNNSIGRITTTGVVTNYTDPTVSVPFGITAGSDGALWFTTSNSIGRITTAGVITHYTVFGGTITAGPDGALWFTASNNSIGRITTAGVVTNYADPSIAVPGAITAGPDGALWFTNIGSNSIGRITTAGVVTNYTGAHISNPGGITAGPDNAMWFTNQGKSEGGHHRGFQAFSTASIGRITTGPTITLTITTSALPNATVGSAYSQTLSATGGNPPYTWKMASGSGKPPRGLMLDEATGTISGTPTKRSTTSTFTVEVLDTKTLGPRIRNTAVATFTITIS